MPMKSQAPIIAMVLLLFWTALPNVGSARGNTTIEPFAIPVSGLDPYPEGTRIRPDDPLTCEDPWDGTPLAWCIFVNADDWEADRARWTWHREFAWGQEVKRMRYAGYPADTDFAPGFLEGACKLGTFRGGYVTFNGALWLDCTTEGGLLAPYLNPDGTPKELGPLRWQGINARVIYIDPEGLSEAMIPYLEASLLRAINLANEHTDTFDYAYGGLWPNAPRGSKAFSILGRDPAEIGKRYPDYVNRILGYAAYTFTGDSMETCDIGLPADAFWSYSLPTVTLHEVLHCFSLPHSSEDPNEKDPVLRNAVMYYSTSRGESRSVLTEWDIAELRKRYS